MLKKHVAFTFPEREEERWDAGGRVLSVGMPRRFDDFQDDEEIDFGDDDEEEFLLQFRNIREALALLSAVAYVDNAAWKMLLSEFCGVKLHESAEDELPARFIVYMDMERRESPDWEDTWEYDLVELCGTHQRKHPSRPYVAALSRIAALDSNLKADSPGVDIAIPVHPYFSGNCRSIKGSMSVFKDVWKGVNEVGNEWRKYDQSSKREEVAPGTLRCTFVLEPVIADFNDYWIRPEMANTMETLVMQNIWFSQVSLWAAVPPTSAQRSLQTNEYKSQKAFGRLMSSVFESARHSLPWGYRGEIEASNKEKFPLQLGTIHLECDSTLGAREFAGIGSAMALNQATKKVSMRLEMDTEDPDNSAQWWRWIAYGIFSKRARSCSALETLNLFSISSMSEADMEAFAEILASEHPEEDLFGCPRGELDERDALLRGGVPIRWQFNSEGRGATSARTLTIDHGVRSVRAFSDDGQSEWVNVLIPGYGRCQVKRSDLMFGQASRMKLSPSGLTSLAIGFDQNEYSISDGLPQFLAAVGSSLTSLTLDLSTTDVADSVIFQSCPNLKELSIGGGLAQFHLDFSEYQAESKPLPQLDLSGHDVAVLAKVLKDPTAPMTKCLRRLRVHLDNLWSGWDSMSGEHYEPRIKTDVEELLQMLEVNRSLEYVDITVPSEYMSFAGKFKEQHLKPTNRALKLSTDVKISFLGVLRARGAATQGKKRRTRSTSQPSQLSFGNLDRHVLAMIFAFAAPPALRQVHFREKDRSSWDNRDEAPI